MNFQINDVVVKFLENKMNFIIQIWLFSLIIVQSGSTIKEEVW